MAHKSSRQREALIWNASPGALGTLPSYGDSRAHYPVASPVMRAPAAPSAPLAPLPAPSVPLAAPPPTPGDTFTALLYVQATSPALYKLLANIASSEACEKVRNLLPLSFNKYVSISILPIFFKPNYIPNLLPRLTANYG